MKSARAAYSFFAAFIGWLVPFVGYLALLQSGVIGSGEITDFSFLLFWPLLFTGLGWLLVGLPFALFRPEQEKLTTGRGLLLGTSVTTVTYLALAIWLGWFILVFIWWPILIGLIGGAVYLTLLRKQPFQEKLWPFWVAPFLCFALTRWVVLPVTEQYFPYTYYVLGEGAIGPEAEWSIIERIEPGDRWEHLHRRYPALFAEPTSSIHKVQGNGWSYFLRFDESGRVSEVQVKRPEAD
jgi:hypothetical protein